MGYKWLTIQLPPEVRLKIMEYKDNLMLEYFLKHPDKKI